MIVYVKINSQGSNTKFCNETLILQLVNVRSLIQHDEDVEKNQSISNVDALHVTDTHIIANHTFEAITQTQPKHMNVKHCICFPQVTSSI